jgi:small-conductance mechanosensitive channel
MTRSLSFLTSLLILPALFPTVAAQSTPPASAEIREQPIESAEVSVDGFRLFHVRGVRSYPAAVRAGVIAQRIRNIAADNEIAADSIAAWDDPAGTTIAAGSRFIMTVTDTDAAFEELPRSTVTKNFVTRIHAGVEDYRRRRQRDYLLKSAGYAAGATVALAILLALVLSLSRRLMDGLRNRYKERIRSLQVQKLEILHAERLWTTFSGVVQTLRAILVAVLCYVYFERCLRLFPWTTALAQSLLDYIVGPLRVIGSGIAGQIPNLFFLSIASIITHYLLKIIRLVFSGLEKGQITVGGFEPEWAWPTYRLIRLLIIALVLVVMYPYIPGAESAAFKGISIFFGVLFSLGSSSALSSVIAGYTMVYRRAFRIGDRVKIGDIVGDVTAMRVLVTHLRTLKNEEITVPNSLILTTQVLNYSSLAREKGLILHTTVTIGYDTPWRQVHGMLLDAADRTEGLLKEPGPYVLQKSLDDFYVSYELNAYTDAPSDMPGIYSRLHENIQDAFNAHGVQIMSPHYENDPAAIKVVPRDRWFEAPARKAES